MINLQISNVNMFYDDSNKIESVQVHFTGRDSRRTYFLNGYIPLTREEYVGNESTGVLENILRGKISEDIHTVINLQISNVNMTYDSEGLIESAQVHFTGRDEDRTYYLNGYIPLAREEYIGNEAVDRLEEIIRDDISEEIQAEDGEPAE